MGENISRTDRALAKLVLLVRFVRKGKNYALVAYPVIRNWYAPALYRAGLFRELRIDIRSTARTSPFFNLRVRLVARLSNGLSYKTPGFDGKHLYLNYKGKDLCFFYDSARQLINTLEQLKDVFIGEEYSCLQVEGKDVVDIGASIGDSAIYFSMNGARHIYAFEPYPYACRIALKNLKLNNLETRVTFLNEFFGGGHGSIRVDTDFQSDEDSAAKNFGKGKRIWRITLEDVVRRYHLKHAVLKIDCEGGEYDVILKSKREVLRRFDQIMIEYHYGYKNLEAKLINAGFRVWHERPFYNFTSKQKKMYQGFIVALNRKSD